MESQRDNRFELPMDRGLADRFVPRYLWKCCAQFFLMSRRFDESCDKSVRDAVENISDSDQNFSSRSLSDTQAETIPVEKIVGIHILR